MLSIGLDVHQDSTAVCELDASGRVARERVIRGGFAAVAQDLASIGQPFRVCFEASCGYGTLHDLLAPLATQVHVAHPTELKLIFRSKHKNDRNDARKIARLLHMDAVPRVHVPGIQVRAWRGLIEHRRRLVDKRTRVKNALRAQLRGLGIKGPRRHTLWSAAGLRWLAEQELPTGLDRLRRSSLLAELEVLSAQVKIVEKELDAIGQKDARVQLLRTIPGVGARTAEAVVAYIDDPSRFGSIKAVGKYFGMVPMQDASAGRNRLGHITREGPATVRKLITQSAWRAVACSPRMKAFYEKLRCGQKQRTGTALVATAHKLLRIMLSMLRSGEPWQEDRLVLGASASAVGVEQTQGPRRRDRGGVKGTRMIDGR